MTQRVQTLRSSVSAQRPTARKVGEFYINFADLALGTILPAGTAQDLLPVRVHASTATYAANDHVVQGGQLRRARTSLIPKTYVAGDWSQWFDTLGVGIAPPVNMPLGGLYVNGSTVSVPLMGSFVINGYWNGTFSQARDAGAVGYLSISGSDLQLKLAPPAAAGAGVTPLTFLSMQSADNVILAPRGKLIVQASSNPIVALHNLTDSIAYSIWGQAGSMQFGNATSAGAVSTVQMSLRFSDHALQLFGPLYAPTVNIGGQPWAFYFNSPNQVEQHATGWNDTWNNTTGTRTWTSPGGNLMSLTGGGNFNVVGSIGGASVYVAGTVQGALLYSTGSVQWGSGFSTLWANASSVAVQFTPDGWRLDFERSNGTLRYYSYAGIDLFHVDASGTGQFRGNVHAVNVYATGSISANTLSLAGAFTAGSIGGSSLNISGAAAIGSLTVGTTITAGSHIVSAASLTGTQLFLQGGFKYYWSDPHQVIEHAPGWNDAYRGSDGLRFWSSPTDLLMQLDGAGNFSVLGRIAGTEIGLGGAFRYYFAYPNQIFEHASGWYEFYDVTNGFRGWNNPSGQQMSLDGASNFTISGQGYKPGGGSWGATSDARIKTVLGDYTRGLEDLLNLSPVRYQFNEDAANVDTTIVYTGLIAQDVELNWPEMVKQMTGKIGGETVTDMRVLDTSELIYALINAVRQLDTRLTSVEMEVP